MKLKYLTNHILNVGLKMAKRRDQHEPTERVLVILFDLFKSKMVSWLAKVIWIWDFCSGSPLDRFHICV